MISASKGDSILDAAMENGIEIDHECGGNCACTTCQIEIVSGGELLSSIEWSEQDRLTMSDSITPHSRLACQALLHVPGTLVMKIHSISSFLQQSQSS